MAAKMAKEFLKNGKIFVAFGKRVKVARIFL
jgi:hypothetical protein